MYRLNRNYENNVHQIRKMNQEIEIINITNKNKQTKPK